MWRPPMATKLRSAGSWQAMSNWSLEKTGKQGEPWRVWYTEPNNSGGKKYLPLNAVGGKPVRKREAQDVLAYVEENYPTLPPEYPPHERREVLKGLALWVFEWQKGRA